MYMMIKRKLIITWLASTIVLIIGIIASFQYTNYVLARNNKQWCTIVSLFDNSYKNEPPTSNRGENFSKEFSRLRMKFKCEDK